MADANSDVGPWRGGRTTLFLMAVITIVVCAVDHQNMSEVTAVKQCQHTPLCPPADAPDHQAAHVVSAHPEQGWSLLCNGIILFDDLGEIMPTRPAQAA